MEAELFQSIERLHGSLLPRDLVGAPDNIAELFLSGCLVEKAKFFRPDTIEHYPSGRGLDLFVQRVTGDCVPAKIRIQEPHFFMDLDRAFRQAELDLWQLMETASPRLRLTSFTWFLGQ